ncbi:MAG TPA: PEGA domain-containing protein [Kofleriaceae bacterium]|nr:PEGA domain-containing protein [Kofleriaceae bacterium]
MIAFGGVAMSRLAHAQDESLNRAREHFDKAQSLYAAQSYVEAAAAFQAAYDERPFAQFLFNIGACHEKLHDYGKAVELYKKYLADEPDASDKAEVLKRIKVLEKEAARVKANPPDPNNPTPDPNAPKPTPSAEVRALGDVKTRGLVVIESDPPGALIYLDDKKSKALSKTPWNGSLDGEHTIFIERQGYKPVERRFAPDPNQLSLLVFTLAEQDYLGWLEVKSNIPGADIYVDDKSVGVFAKTPYSGNIKPGKHKIWVTTEGYDEFYKEVDIVAGETHEISASLKGNPVGYLNMRGTGVDKMAIYLDGKLLCERGPCRKAVSEGQHTVEVKRSGYKTYTRTFEVQAKTEITLRADLAKNPGRGDAIWAYVFTGAFLGGGIYLGLQASNIESELEGEISMNAGQVPPDSEDPRFMRGKLFSIGADAAFALAGITAITAVYYTFRDKGRPSTGALDVRAVALEPRFSPTFAGAVMEVNW